MGWDTATFEMPPGLTREDVHVGFSDSWSAERITVSWQYITTEQFVEDGKLIREKRLRNYHRTLPLPKGVQVRQSDTHESAGYSISRTGSSSTFRRDLSLAA